MSDVLYERDDALALVTLNRPDARNAYSESMVRELIEALGRAGADAEVRVVIITGAGRSFSAGGDVKAMRDRTGMFAGDPIELRRNYLTGIQQIPLAFDTFEKPVVAAINGAAVGAGLDLACMCDIRIASRRAKFGSGFPRLGLVPGDGGAFLLSRTVGFPRALELTLTGRIIDAERALAIDLVHELADPELVQERAREVALEIAAQAPRGVQLSKTLMYRTANKDLLTALQFAAALQALAQHDPEHDQAVEALLAKLAK